MYIILEISSTSWYIIEGIPMIFEINPENARQGIHELLTHLDYSDCSRFRPERHLSVHPFGLTIPMVSRNLADQYRVLFMNTPGSGQVSVHNFIHYLAFHNKTSASKMSEVTYLRVIVIEHHEEHNYDQMFFEVGLRNETVMCGGLYVNGAHTPIEYKQAQAVISLLALTSKRVPEVISLQFNDYRHEYLDLVKETART